MDYTTDNQAAKPDAGRAVAADLAKKLEGHWVEAKGAANRWRKEAREDRAFYDGKQWTDEERHALEEQGRAPIVINQVFKAINNLVGRERDSRLDWKALPRGASDVQAADAITKALAFVGDATRAKYAISASFKDAVKGPMGWLEVGIDDADPTKEPLFVRHIDPFEVWLDPHTTQLDLTDARYIVRAKWVDLDLALAAYPDKADALKGAVSKDKEGESHTAQAEGDDYGNGVRHIGADAGEWCDHDRQRVQLREHWYWENEQAKFWQFPDGRVIDFVEGDPDVMAHLEQGAQVKTGVRRCYYFAVVAGKTVMAEGKSPYPFARFPFVPVFAYVSDKGQPFGVIRMMKDPQRELNVNRSRLNEAMRSRWAIVKQGSMTPGALNQLGDDLARSNFIAEVVKPEDIQISSDKADVPGWAQMMETSRREVDDVAGQNETAYGDKDSSAKSGIAKQVQVAQQGLNMGEVFDNLRLARLQVGEMLVALVQKFYPMPKLQRIIEASLIRENPKQDLTWVEQAFANPIEQLRFDIVIDDQAETTTERQAAMEQATNLLQMAGPLAPSLIPDVIRMSDFADKEEMASKLEAAMAPPPPPMPPQAPPMPPMAPDMGQMQGSIPGGMPPEGLVDPAMLSGLPPEGMM